MNKTNDFKYNLPAYSDPVDIEDLNDNFRSIDDALMAGLCKKDYTGNNMGSSDPSARKYAWAPWFEIVNDNEFDVVVTDRNAPVESEEATINIAAGQTVRKYINGRYYMNFYVQDQYDVTFKWFTNAETYINESGGGGGGTGTVTSVSVQGGSGSHLTASGNPIETSGTITINVDDGYSIPSDNEQTAWDGKAADLKFEINSSTFVITAQLKDASGNLIGNERTIDLPLESVVVSGDYDEQTKKVILTLQNGSTIEFSVADLVSGLQTELNSNNKLNPEYIAYDASHRAVSDTEKDTWNAKQNAIDNSHKLSSDLVDDADHTNKFVTSTEKQTWNAKQNAIDADHKLSSSLVSFTDAEAAALASGIDSSKVGQISTNQTNILYILGRTGRNLYNSEDCVINTRLDSQGKEFYELGYQTSNYIPISNISTLVRNVDFSIMESLCEYDENKGFISRTPDGSGSSVSLNANTKYVRTSLATSRTNVLLCSAEDWNVSHEYTPYRGLQNYDLTQLESEDRAALAEVVDSGVKNLIPYIPSLDTETWNSTFTRTSSSVTTTATGDYGFTAFVIPNLKPGTYVLSTDIANRSGSNSTRIDVRANASSGSVLASKTFSANGSINFEFTVNTTMNLYVLLYGSFGTFVDTTTFTANNLMLCTKAAWKISQNYVQGVLVPKIILCKNYVFTADTTLAYTGVSYVIPENTTVKITASAVSVRNQPNEIAICNNSDQNLILAHNSAVEGKTNGIITTELIYSTSNTTYTVAILAKYAGATENYVSLLVEKLN